MNRDEVKEAIKNNPELVDFIKSDKTCLPLRIGAVEILIYKENLSTVSYYYKGPYDSNTDYSTVDEYMNYAIPILKELLEQYDKDKLMTSNCIR